LRQLGDVDFEGAIAVDTARENGVPGLAFDGDAFAGNGALIDGGLAAEDGAIDGDAFAGAHNGEVAEFELFDVDFLLDPIKSAFCDTPTVTKASAARPSATKSSAWNPTEFPIGYWVGPPMPFNTLERYEEIKHAGLNIVTATQDGSTSANNHKMLEYGQKTGMKVFLGDSRLPPKIDGDPEVKKLIDAAIEDYKGHPALAGYELYDEPNASAFKGIGEVVAYMREKDPLHPVLINLLPNYATPEQTGTPTYEEYVRRFLEEVRPDILCYDHYHFGETFERPEFFPNLEVVRRLAKEYNVPFWQITLLTHFAVYRNLTESEIRYEAMQTLAYGGKGLRWFTYWTPSDPSFDWKNAMVTLDGTRTPHYDMVRRVNQETRVLGNELLQAESLAVFHTGEYPVEVTRREAGTPIEILGKSKTTVGVFRRNAKEQLALVTNGDHAQAAKIEVLIYSGTKLPQRLNSGTGKWEAVKGTPHTGGYRVTVDLPAAGAALLKW
jgi:hypothetical protein